MRFATYSSAIAAMSVTRHPKMEVWLSWRTSATRPDVDFPKIGVYVRTKFQLSQKNSDCKHQLKKSTFSRIAENLKILFGFPPNDDNI
jgi:hypothetical protein